MRRAGQVDEQAVVAALLDAYRQGAFPMAEPRTSRVEFYTADPRGLLPLNESPDEQGWRFHIPERLERTIRQQRFELTCDTAFEEVMKACRDVRPRSERWINQTIIAWYAALHRAGHAHSIEAWRTDPATGERAMVGGIYGVSMGAAFFGESMFVRPRPRRPDGSRDPLDGTDASKVCLVALVRHLRACGFALFDTQMVTEHVGRFGGRELPAAEYLPLLKRAVACPHRWRAPGGAG